MSAQLKVIVFIVILTLTVPNIYIHIVDGQSLRSLHLLFHDQMDKHKEPWDVHVHMQDNVLMVVVAFVLNGHIMITTPFV